LPYPYFLEQQCLEEGAFYKAMKNHKDKVLIAKTYTPAPTIDDIMPTTYVHHARLLMTRYR
jgi:hypothetical protein